MLSTCLAATAVRAGVWPYHGSADLAAATGAVIEADDYDYEYGQPALRLRPPQRLTLPDGPVFGSLAANPIVVTGPNRLSSGNHAILTSAPRYATGCAGSIHLAVHALFRLACVISRLSITIRGECARVMKNFELIGDYIINSLVET